MCKENSQIPKTILDFFQLCTEQNITYCHWKSNEHLLKGLMGKTDLDVLAEAEDKSALEKVLAQCNFKRVISHPWNTYNNVEDWMGVDYASGVQFHLHLHYALITGKKNVKEQKLPWEKLMLENRVLDDNTKIYICNPNLEILILYTRILLKRFKFRPIPNNNANFKFSKPDAMEIEYLKKRIKETEVRAFAGQMFSDSCADMLMEAISASYVSNKFMRSLQKKIDCELKKDRLYSDISTNVKSFIRWVIEKTQSVLHIKGKRKKKVITGGKLIAFLGADGSGKTTLATYTTEWLSWKIAVRYVYLGTGEGKASLLNRLLRRRAAKKNKKNAAEEIHMGEGGNTKKEKSDKKYPMWKLTLLNFVALSNAGYKKKMIKKIQKYISQGEIVITDRYPQLQYEGINDGVAITELGTGIYKLINTCLRKRELKIMEYIAVYNPQIVIKLIIPLEVSRQRKQDSSEDTIRKKIQIVEEIHYGNAKEYSIDSAGKLEDTKEAVRECIWNCI